MVTLNTPACESRSQVQSFKNSPQLPRLWRPAAQRNLRNQWSKLDSLCSDWGAAVSAGRSYATSLVNSYLSKKYINGMDFGVLSDMPNIRTKASHKLFMQQLSDGRDKFSPLRSFIGVNCCRLTEIVAVVTRMVNVCKNMRCYFKGTTGSPLAQFSLTSEDGNDSGECGGISVFTFLSIPAFEELAWEIVRMFISELNLKRLLVMELVSIIEETTGLHWSDEFYEGEFDDLSTCSLYSKETQEPVLPSLDSSRSSASSIQNNKQQHDNNVLQVLLTTWLVEANIDRCRVDEIFGIVGEEMHFDFLAKSAS